MLSPQRAQDILLSQSELHTFIVESGMKVREARRMLGEIAAPLYEDGAPPLESLTLRTARAAQADRRRGTGARDDIEALCAFVERAGHLVNGRTRKQCADRLGISVETVRRHLRRLRLTMREHDGVLSAEIDPGQFSRERG